MRLDGSCSVLFMRRLTLPAVSLLLLLLSSTCRADFSADLVAAALDRTTRPVIYNGAYFKIAYPNGDVPAHFGVCTDVIIRAYRSLDTDLQVLVHEDMQANFSQYPSHRIWGLNRTDRNIDHRRVPNLQAFFSRHGQVLPQTRNPQDYRPGDLVTWMLPGNAPHIGIVTDRISDMTGNPMIVHNIGWGPKLDDMLFEHTITGHYRYMPEQYKRDRHAGHQGKGNL